MLRIQQLYFTGLVLFLSLFVTTGITAQTKNFKINDQHFVIVPGQEKNEWNTKDQVRDVYRVEGKQRIKLLRYYIYKDEGGDCNNLFWNKERLTIQHDSLVLLTHYFQKTGLDPIPEWRKQIFVVQPNGELQLLYDKYKYYRRSEWVSVTEH